MEKILYQITSDNLPLNSSIFSAFEGFQHLGHELKPFKSLLMERLDKDTLVIGSINSLKTAFNQLKIKIPLLDYPEDLINYFGRNISEGYLHNLNSILKNSTSVFIKPKISQKLFTGLVISSTDSLKILASYSPNTSVWFSGVVNFVSEYRVYILNRDIIGIKQYQGNCKISPDISTIENMVKDYKSAPLTYSMDVGITQEGKTLLVECNNAYALGNYGLDSIEYANFILNGWREVINEKHNLDSNTK